MNVKVCSPQLSMQIQGAIPNLSDPLNLYVKILSPPCHQRLEIKILLRKITTRLFPIYCTVLLNNP